MTDPEPRVPPPVVSGWAEFPPLWKETADYLEVILNVAPLQDRPSSDRGQKQSCAAAVAADLR